MKKVLLFGLILILGGIYMSGKTNIESTLSFSVNSATNYLEVRPNSDKNNNPLTKTQLLAFLDTVTVEVQQAIDGLYDVDQSYLTSRLETITALLSGLSQEQFDNDTAFYYSQFESLFELYSLTLESKNVEGRGMWHRPFESNLSQVRETLQSLQDMGINMLYVETFWMGRLIYDSQVPDTFQHFFTLGGYKDDSVDYGTNLLQAFVEEGKQYGIEVHAWVENFFVGYGAQSTDSPILKIHPEWASYNYDGTIPQKREVNYLFMDPANPETRDYLKAIYMEIATSFDIASIHLDYIRYPVAQNVTNPLTSNQDTGYSDYAEKEFKSIYGYTGDVRQLVISNPQAAADWKEYKTQVISDFVAGVYYAVKTVNPDVYLSTAIFGNLGSALDTKMQDWSSWIDDGYVELILPMAYYQSSITVRSEVANLTNIVDGNAFSYAGIAPSYMGYNDHLNTTQIEGSLDGKAMGVTFFASQRYLVRNVDGVNTYNTKVQNILKNGTFRNDAIRPHDDTTLVVNTILDLILDKSNRIYIPNNVITNDNVANLEILFTTYRSYPVETVSELNQLISTLETFDASIYASGIAVDRINEDIQNLIDILVIKSKRIQLDNSIDLTVNPDQNTYFEDPIELDIPQNIALDGAFITWDEVEHNSGYIVNINDQIYYANTNSFDIRNASLRDGVNVVGIQAQGDDITYSDSEYGTIIQFNVEQLDAPTNIRIIDNVLYFDPIPNATEYYIRIGTKIAVTTEPYYDLSEKTYTNNEYSITIKARGNNIEYIDSKFSDVITYKAGDLALEFIFSELFTNFAQSNLGENEEE